MKFITKSGSVYEVDKENKRIRRLNDEPANGSVRITGDWKAFDKHSPITIGQSVAIFWTDAEQPLDETKKLFLGRQIVNTPFTTTTEVISLIEENQGEPN